jgi:subtilisin family serine protease
MSLIAPDDPLVALPLNKAMAKGIIVVAADTGSAVKGENFPASLKNVISVRTNKQDNSVTSALLESINFSGCKILTTLPYGTYDFISGNSIVTAEVSGVVALLLELKHEITVAETYIILQKAKLLPKDGSIAGVSANSAVSTLCETIACNQHVLSFAQKTTL